MALTLGEVRAARSTVDEVCDQIIERLFRGTPRWDLEADCSIAHIKGMNAEERLLLANKERAARRPPPQIPRHPKQRGRVDDA